MYETNHGGLGADYGWVVGWNDGWFCNCGDIDDGDVESVVYDARSSQKFVGCCDIELAWSQDMVKNGFVYLVAEK